MSKPVTPVVLSDDGSRHEPMAEGGVFAASALPLSDNRQNLLERDSSGLLLTGDMLVSALDNNALVDNVDGKLYIRPARMLDPQDTVLSVVDNLLRARLSMSFDPATSRLALLGRDDAVVSELALPVAPGLPTVVEILQDIVPPLPEGFLENPYPRGTYLHMRFRLADGKTTDIYINVSKLVDIYTGGLGIAIEDNAVSVRVLDDGVLGFSKDGSLRLFKRELISADADNALRIGSDNRLYAEGGGITADKVGLGLTVDSDGVVSIDVDALAEALADKIKSGISSDSGNILSLGSDGKPYLPADLGTL